MRIELRAGPYDLDVEYVNEGPVNIESCAQAALAIERCAGEPANGRSWLTVLTGVLVFEFMLIKRLFG